MFELGNSGVYTLGVVHVDGSGGPTRRACTLAPELFRAAAMVEEKVDLMRMTVAQLRSELAARGASKGGQLKSVLRGRLRALIIARHATPSPTPAAGKRRRESVRISLGTGSDP